MGQDKTWVLKKNYQTHFKFITLKEGYPKNVLLSSLDPNPIYHVSFLIITIVDNKKKKKKQREGMRSCTTNVVEKVRQSR